MPRKQLGKVDEDLLDRVDARARLLGQTRRMFTERALSTALELGMVDQASADGRIGVGSERAWRDVVQFGPVTIEADSLQPRGSISVRRPEDNTS